MSKVFWQPCNKFFIEHVFNTNIRILCFDARIDICNRYRTSQVLSKFCIYRTRTYLIVQVPTTVLRGSHVFSKNCFTPYQQIITTVLVILAVVENVWNILTAMNAFAKLAGYYFLQRVTDASLIHARMVGLAQLQ